MSRQPNRSRVPVTSKLTGLQAAMIVATVSSTCPQLVFAQEGEPSALEEITVTATRVERSGFTAPTPTTMLDAEQLADRAYTNISDALNDIPSFRSTFTAGSTGPSMRGALNTPDLRGIGPSRTLVLIDNQRAVPATLTGLTDMNLIPSLLIERVEVVTGGASAGWGSDAVAGVVNLILKKELEGLQLDAMGGESQYHDNKEVRIGVAGGINFLDERGNATLALDYDNNKGVFDQYQRPWGKQNYGLYSNPCAGVAGTPVVASLGCVGNVTNGLTRRLVVPNVFVGNFTSGGLVTGVTGGAPASLLGTGFGAGGTPYAFQYGSLATLPVASTTTPTTINTTVTQAVGANVNGNTFPASLSLQVPVKRYNALGRVSFDFTDNLSGFASVLYAHSESANVSFPNRVSGTTAATIRADNAYLPASVRALMPVNSTLRVGREIQDNFGHPLTTNINKTFNIAAGVSGKFAAGWSWDLNAEVGQNQLDQHTDNVVITNNFNLAVDAITSGGQIVCRRVATNPSCVPFNIFGQGSPSAAAEAYVRGTQSQQQTIKQRAAALTVRGEPLSIWAGPISLATGLEYRKEQADSTVDAIALAGGYLTGSFNQKPLHGSYDVKEGFVEAVVPLLKELPFAKSLDFDGAVRYTDYSISGNVTTWKAGLVYTPVDQLKVRATRSRDIRAPNLQELYAFGVPTTPNTLTNPWKGGANAGSVPTITSGNVGLQPEVADTLTYGIVFQPTSQLSVSVDYYDIDIKGTISTVANQTIIDQCYAGNVTLCGLVTLDASNNITQLRNQTVNIALSQVKGVDLQASYRLPLAQIFGSVPGDLRFDLNATRSLDVIVNDGITGPINRVGEMGGNTQTTNATSGRPKWMAALAINYTLSGTTVGTQVRYVGNGVYNVQYAEGVTGIPATGGLTINDNTVPSKTYVSLNASHDIVDRDGLKLQVYGVVNNVFNNAPPADPVGGGGTNPQFYDVIGRMYKLGVRASF
jgi:iron complex outermembrane recepter protein